MLLNDTKLRDFLNDSQDFIIQIGVDHVIHYANPIACGMLGMDHKKLVHKNWVKHFVPLADQEMVEQLLLGTLSANTDHLDFSHPLQTASNETIHFKWKGLILKNELGHVKELLLTGIPAVTNPLPKDDTVFCDSIYFPVFDYSQTAIALYDVNGTLLEVNQAYKTLLNIKTNDQLKNQNLFADPHITDDMKKLLQNNQPVFYEVLYNLSKTTKANPSREHLISQLYLDVKITPIDYFRSTNNLAYIVQMQDITERILVEQALKLSEDRYRTIFDSAGDAIFVQDRSGRIVDINKVACDRLEYTQEELYQLPPYALYPSERAQEFPKKIIPLLKNGSTIFQTEHVTKSGSIIPVELHAQSIQYSGTPHVLTVARDISERINRLQQLAKEQYEAKKYFEGSGVMMLVLATNQTIQSINPRGCQILGVNEKDLIGQNWFDHFIPQKNKKKAQQVFTNLLDGQIERYSYWENELVNLSGQVRLMAWHNTVLKNDAGEIYAVLSSGEDITHKKQIQESVQRNATIRAVLHQFMQLALENLSLDAIMAKIIQMITDLSWLDLSPKAAIYLLDHNRGVLLCKASQYKDDNEELATKLIPLGDNLIGITAYTGTIEIENIEEYNQQHIGIPLKTSGDMVLGVIELYSSSGTEFSRTNQSFLQTIAQVLVGIIQQKQAEDQLKIAYNRLNDVMSAMPTIMIIINDHNVVTQWNTIAEKNFNLPSEDAIGKSFPDLPIPWKWNNTLKKLPFIIYKNKSLAIKNIRFTKPDDSEGFLDLKVSPVRTQKSRTSEFLVIGTEITETKNLQIQLLQSQKLESIGQLAAGIAHEINTPTQYIGDNIRFIQDAFNDLDKLTEKQQQLAAHVEKDQHYTTMVQALYQFQEEIDLSYLESELPKAVEQSLDGIEKVSTIVKALKGFAHPDSGKEKVPVDLNKAIENTITVARNEWKYIADLETHFDTKLPLVTCYPGEINQVILNMIVNAAHAIADKPTHTNGVKGTISISTSQQADLVEIKISDTGSGIPKKVKDKIFDPFFTTKDVGKGTGQGLAISHAVIVDKHNGNIRVESTEGKGTTFFITLPLNEKKEI